MKNKLALALLIVCAISLQGILSIKTQSNSTTQPSIINGMINASAQSGATPELPRAYLNTNYTPPAGRTIAVSAGGDFQAALNQAQPGDVITLQAGATFTGNFTLPNKSGSGWIVIRSSTADSNLPRPGARVTPSFSSVMPKIISPNSEPAIRTASGAHHYRFIGLEIGVQRGVRIYDIVRFGGGENSLSQLPNNLIVDRCYIHGNPADTSRRGVMLNSASTAVIDSYISDIHEEGADSQAICGWNGPGPFKIVNNYLEGAGENVMFGGAPPSIQNLIPSDIEFRLNHLYKPVSWKKGHSTYAGRPWTIKNIFEIKNGQRLLVDQNVFENNWAGAQVGFAILFTPRGEAGVAPWATAQDVTFTNNILRHSGSGINIAGADSNSTSQPSHRILIRNNLIDDIDGDEWGSVDYGPASGRFAQIVGGPRDITIEHNTIFQSGTLIIADNGPSPGFVFRNNIANHNQYGVTGSGKGVGSAAMSYYFPGAIFERNVIVGTPQGVSYPGNNFTPATMDQVGFVNLAGGDYRLAPSSPYRNAGTDGKDIGCQLGVPSTSNPSPPPSAPTISGVSATNITASSASINWATNAASDSQVEYGLTASYGTQSSLNAALITNHQVTLTGLASNTTYHYRVKSRDAAGTPGVSPDFTFITAVNPPVNPPDKKAPVISAVAGAVNGSSSATIKWATDEMSDSQVEYGVTSLYGGATPVNPARVMQHSVTLTGLVSGSRYHYRVKSRDAAGNLAVSGDFTITVGSGPVAEGRQPVTWMDIVKATLTGNTLKKTAGCDGCESTAVSQQMITSGNGYLEVPAIPMNSNWRIGLMRAGQRTTQNNIDFAIGVCNNGSLSIRERGVYRTETACRAGDIFRIAVENGAVKYYKNGAAFYQSRVAPAYPLVAAVTLFSLNASVSNITIATTPTLVGTAPTRTRSDLREVTRR